MDFSIASLLSSSARDKFNNSLAYCYLAPIISLLILIKLFFSFIFIISLEFYVLSTFLNYGISVTFIRYVTYGVAKLGVLPFNLDFKSSSGILNK